MKIRNPKSKIQNKRSAFTLVEMLVAVGLVLLMMSLFTTIFQMATGAMATQKGLAENDQRVRLVLSLLRDDLNGDLAERTDPTKPRVHRTFRNLIPFGPDEQNQSTITLPDRLGYFYISENNPNDDTDDVLALTVAIPAGASERFFGRAAVLFPDSKGSYGPGNPSPGNNYPPPGTGPVPLANTQLNAGQSYWGNQPEFDDTLGGVNEAGDSTVAEVCYFLRNGTLYRRMLLVRQPNVSGTPNNGEPQDSNTPPVDLNVNGFYGPTGTRNFWTDFDYSAYFDSLTTNRKIQFNATANNEDSLPYNGSTVNPNPFVLGNPAMRFGFDSDYVTLNQQLVPGQAYGLPREFVPDAMNSQVLRFIGRFTHRETSDLAFGYPGRLNGSNQSPMNPANNAVRYDAVTGIVTLGGNDAAGPRAGEDVLMTNVHKFDIKVWDPAASVGPDGHAGVGGFIHPVTKLLNDDDGDNVADNTAEMGWLGSDDGAFVDIGYAVNAGVLGSGFYSANPQNVPTTMFRNAPTNTKKYFYPNPANNNPGAFINRYDTWNPTLDFYRNGIPPDGISDCPPFRPFNFGADGRPGVAGFDDDGNKVIDDISELGWPNTDDQPVPLTAIQIKITFFDLTSNQLREVTLVQSLHYP